MIRLSGIQLLAVSIVLWALAVWMFGASHPAATETAATAPAEAMEKPGTGAGEADRVDGTAAPPPAARADQGSPTPPDPGAGAGSASPQAGSARIGETVSVHAPAGTPMPPTATGDGSRIALAPAPGSRDSAADTTTSPPATGTGPATGSPFAPRGPETSSPRGSVGAPDIPPPAQTHPWYEHPLSRPPPPAGTTADGNAIADQINTARRAAWEGRFAEALAHYRAAARIQPNNHVVWGEMGNVLWAMRRWPEAAYALEGAATLLVRAGELRAASELVPAVGKIDPDAAYRVQRLLWAAAQRQSG